MNECTDIGHSGVAIGTYSQKWCVRHQKPLEEPFVLQRGILALCGARVVGGDDRSGDLDVVDVFQLLRNLRRRGEAGQALHNELLLFGVEFLHGLSTPVN